MSAMIFWGSFSQLYVHLKASVGCYSYLIYCVLGLKSLASHPTQWDTLDYAQIIVFRLSKKDRDIQSY